MAKKDIVVSLRDLLEAGVHFGHQVRRRHPKMDPYIYGEKGNIHIFDLEITAKKLTEAARFVEELGEEGKSLLMVGTKRQAIKLIKSAAEEAGCAYMTKRWVGGFLTNWKQVSKNIDKLNNLREGRELGRFQEYTKLERLRIDMEIEKLEDVYGGVENLENMPDALFVIDSRREETALKEALMQEIPVVAVCDSNADPDDIAYMIPGNDDARKAIELYCQVIADYYKKGREKYLKRAEEASS